jgi:CheY-like chemotaxis protein
MHVLVVDDDPHIRDFLSQALDDEGYMVSCANDGQHALDQLRLQASQPCIILLDLMMPTMNGWQFRAVQQGDPALAGIPVVVLSARTDAQQQADTLAAHGFLPKPIDLDRLFATVRRLCGTN